MAMIKCKECGKEMSDHARVCPNCGAENNVMFCPECDKQLSRKATMCPNCGYVFQSNIDNKIAEEKGENYNMALGALICSFFGITSIISLVLGIVVLNSNKGKQPNTAKSMGIASIIISSVYLVIIFYWIMFCSYYIW